MSKSLEKRFSHVAKGVFFVAAAFAIVWFVFQPSWFEDLKMEVTNQPYARTITVTGEGEVTSKPDMAVVNLSVVSQKKSVKEVTADGNERMNRVVAAVKKLGVSDDDVKTVSYNLRPEYVYPENRKAVISGYRLDQSLRVKVRDLSKVEDVLDSGVEAGANQVGQLSFEIDDDSEQKSEARVEAFRDSREKAEAMAKAAGVKLGDVITFSESGGFEPPVAYYGRGLDMAVSESVASPAIEPGSQDTKVTVSVTYEIE